ncbi:MAG TPA: quinone-dependent dihydroorotate dehydrogenase [Chitinophagaceae bacterium]|nr:quinone-dependent dihydroorotate dehydrogenase [Chitinophagaceae bacterium]
MYALLRNFLFLFAPEGVHYFSMNLLRVACRFGPLRRLLARGFAASRPLTPAGLGNLIWRNPIGLGAGFDKNGRYLRELDTLGFGFVEVGTVTPLPQAGNEKPRLFRLPQDQALINRMGFNNDGVRAVAERVRAWRASQPDQPGRMLIGGNIGKNKQTPNEEAWKDYEACLRGLHDCVDYFVVNVSSPNTPGLRELQEKDSLRRILGHLQTINESLGHPKPLLLKIAPDLTDSQVDDVIDLARDIHLDGLVVSNTTVSREGLRTPASRIQAIGPGGLSGRPLLRRSTELLAYIQARTQGRIPIVASGGVFTARDAREKLAAGASLVQVWTGFIYVGPSIVRRICRGLS